jgi:hypothetical protein
MSTKLNVKQWALASLAVFVIMTIVQFVLSKLGVEPWFFPASQEQTGVAPDAMTGRIATYLSRLILAGLFTYIFTKTTYEDKSSMGHGLRYGFGIGLLMYVPPFVWGLAFSGFSTNAQTIFMVVGIIQSVVCGAAMAQLYKSGKPAAA